MADSILYIVLKGVVFLMRFLPLSVGLFLARLAGAVYYYLAGKKNRRSYAHLKLAFGFKSDRELKRIIKRMYQSFAQNAVETLYLPYVDEGFVKKHISICQEDVVREALRAGRGIIFLGSHAGSWELSNIACAMLFSNKDQNRNQYAMLAQPQSKTKKVDAFLNALRESKGCRVIGVSELKKMVTHLSDNNMLGVVADHGGQDGIPVEFFGKLALTPIGSVRLAKKLGSKIILAFMHRRKGADHELIFKAYDLKVTADPAEDLKVNLTEINKIFEGWISQYPEEYLWFYKRWKHSPQRNILVLSDGKLGHLKQSMALVEVVKTFGFQIKSDVVELSYQRYRPRLLLTLMGLFFGPRVLRTFLRGFLKEDCAARLLTGSYDLIISAGASLAGINLACAFENNARSVSIMRPGMFSPLKFDLVIIPEHDRPAPGKNVLVTTGALNSVDAGSMKNDFMQLCSLRHALEGAAVDKRLKIGLLVGGDSKNYQLTPETAVVLCQQLRKILEETDGSLFLTTSRRTSGPVVAILKKYFKDYPRCKLFVDAALDNPAGTVGGIFYLSDIVVVSGESVSMVSEAASSGKRVIVFMPQAQRKNNKVRRFLDALASRNYISLVDVSQIADRLREANSLPLPKDILNARMQVSEGLKKIL